MFLEYSKFPGLNIIKCVQDYGFRVLPGDTPKMLPKSPQLGRVTEFNMLNPDVSIFIKCTQDCIIGILGGDLLSQIKSS